MEPHFARFGISGSQWGVLRVLSRARAAGDAGLRLTDIGRRLLIRPPSVTGAIDRLQRQGYVVREPSPEDQRAKRVSLTPAGRELAERVLEHHGAQVRSVMSGLSEARQRELHRLLARLSEHLEHMAGARDSAARNGSRGEEP
jgi:MarR family 2-MHQ and catechol resistance regulon transcriptional repressor